MDGRVRLSNKVRLIEGPERALLVNLQNGKWARLPNDLAKMITSAAASEWVHANALSHAYQSLGIDTCSMERMFDNLLRAGILLRQGQDPPPGPREVFEAYIIVTDRCNLSCLTCSLSSRPIFPNNDLPTETVLRIIDTIAHDRNAVFVITGGEPLLRNDIEHILKHAFLKGRGISLQTNGVLLDEKTCQMVTRYVDWVEISLDGADEESSAPVRGKGAFSSVIAGIKRLKALGFNRISTSMVINRFNAHKVEDYIKLNEQLGIEYMLRQFHPIGRGFKNRDKLELVSDEVNNSLRTKAKKRIDEIGLAGHLQKVRNEMKACENCGAGIRRIAILANGDVRPCASVLSQKAAMGNILDYDSLDDLLSQDFNEKLVASFGVDNREDCKECDVRYFCGYCLADMPQFSDNIGPRIISDCKSHQYDLQRIIWGN
ncbi:MAG: radical SAM protein [Bacillota bacterium]